MRNLLALAFLAAAACGGHDVSRTVGARCDVNADCDDRCLAPSNDFPAGFCTLACDSDLDCPGSAACVDDQGGVCLFLCEVDEDCAYLGPGWGCADRDARPGGGKVGVCHG